MHLWIFAKITCFWKMYNNSLKIGIFFQKTSYFLPWTRMHPKRTNLRANVRVDIFSWQTKAPSRSLQQIILFLHYYRTNIMTFTLTLTSLSSVVIICFFNYTETDDWPTTAVVVGLIGGSATGTAPLMPMSSSPFIIISIILTVSTDPLLSFWYVSNIVDVVCKYSSNEMSCLSFVSFHRTINSSCFARVCHLRDSFFNQG